MGISFFSKVDFESWERFYRANVLSALSGYKPAMLVGTISNTGRTNLALFQNIVHLGANPALIGMINRPETATPHTLQHIRQTGQYTLNAVTRFMVEQAHQCSAKYDEETSEFDAVGLQPVFRQGHVAPFVAESPVQVAMELVEIVPIQHNQTFLIIGRVNGFGLMDGLLQQDGFVNLGDADVVCTNGLDAYALPTLINRLAYAKPGKTPGSLL